MLTSLKQAVRKGIRQFGIDVRRIERTSTPRPPMATDPPMIDPVWPLPRRPGGPSDEEIRAAFARFDVWHYGYQFEGGLSFAARHKTPDPHSDRPERPLQRFRHFMRDLVASQGGSLRGKRVLDIACNSGFWSIQCALLGAEVVGFDARDELIEQANLIKSIVGLDNVTFQKLDFWSLRPEVLGGTFDVVLNLGILYHLPEPIEVLRITRSMASSAILLDSAIAADGLPVIRLKWEEPIDIQDASTAGVVSYPSKTGLDLILRHLRVREWSEIPIRTWDMPRDYLKGERASWLIRP